MGDLLRNSFRNIVIFNLANHTFIRYVLLVEYAIPVSALESIVQGSTNTKSAPASKKSSSSLGSVKDHCFAKWYQPADVESAYSHVNGF